MSPNGQPAKTALRVAAVPMQAGTVFAHHSHPAHQLAWTDEGVLEVLTGDVVWVLPPTRALWLPAGVTHETRATGPTILRGVYVDPDRCPVAWAQPQPVSVSPLLAALLLHLGGALERAARERAEALLPDLLEPVEAVTIEVTMPLDDRAREVAEALLANPADPRSLQRFGHDVGAAGRTLSRAFRAETGITFSRWRAAVRMRAALPLLAAGHPIGGVAPAVGYETASAFVAAFRRETGTTPVAYFRRPG